MSRTELRAALEAIFYAAEEPVTLPAIKESFPGTDSQLIEETLQELIEEYGRPGRGVSIRPLGGGYRLSTRPEYHEQVRKFIQGKPGFKLSMAALETLAIVAYKQPVTIPEILQIRGIKSPGAIKTLLEKKLIAARGRKKIVGSPMQYGTSREFLVHFGLDSLKDLPTLEEFEEIFGDKADRVQQRSLFDLKMAGVREGNILPFTPGQEVEND